MARLHREYSHLCGWILCTAIACSANSLLASKVRGGDNRQPVNPVVNFQRDVAPILQATCIDCHGARMQLGDLRLDQRRFAIVEGQDRDLIKPGKSAESLLIQRLTDKEAGLIMPPSFAFFPEDQVGLPEEEIQILRRWIDQGANWPQGVVLTPEDPQEEAVPGANELFAAIRAGNRTETNRLLSNRSLVKATDRNGATPLMHAALYADAAMMRQIIDAGADVNATERSGSTALMFATDDLDKVRLLTVRGAKINVHSKLGRTPLMIASTYVNNADVVQFLLRSGASVTDRDLFGETALTSASARGDQKMVKALIDAGADVRASGGFAGRSPLEWAADEGNTDNIICLLDHGAGKDADSLSKALFNAAVRGSTKTVRLLLDNGAGPNGPAGFGAYTPLMGAAYSDYLNTEVVELLLEHGADVAATSPAGDTALSLARKRGHTKIVDLLVKAGADK